MPKFSAASRAQLLTCDERLQRVMVEAIKLYDFAVIEGHRGEAAQNIAFAKGNSQKRWPNGEHNGTPSRACDIQPYPIDWSDAQANTQRACLLAGIVLACAFHLGIKLRWGGDWNMNGDTRDEHFRDYGHFELHED
jgi:peptidoglycan L-alanyl-D-glutamate endopeptidase CwlK